MVSPDYAGRRERLQASLAARKLDGFLVSALFNIRYLTGFTGSNAMFLLSPEGPMLFTDPRYTFQAAREAGCPVKTVRGPLYKGVLKAIHKLRLKKIGFESARMTCDTHRQLTEKLPLGASLEPVAGAVEKLRAIKSASEIDLIRAAVVLTSKAFEDAARQIRPGLREFDVASELEYRMRRLGAESAAFETIAISGEATALPHARPSAKRLNPNELLLVDMGARRSGYTSDMTRMLHLGAPSARTRRLYRAVREAQAAATAAVRHGVKAARVHRTAREVLRGYGWETAFMHSTGHGLGLEIHEFPRLGRGEKASLRAGMVVTIEPGVYLEGFGGVRIEDTVVVTPAGCEVLTPTSKELRVI
jgi:Xaa-Pro aminopeptidase